MTRQYLLGWWGAWVICAAAAPICAAEVEPSAEYLMIQQAFLREDFSRVTSLSQSFILQHPDAWEVPRVWLWLALSLDRLKESIEALRELDRLKLRLSLRDPLWAETLYWEGEISRHASRSARARAAYHAVIERYASSTWAVQARLGLGLSDFHDAAYESALAQFRQVLADGNRAQSPAGLEARLYEALCLIQLERHEEALEILLPLVATLQDPWMLGRAAFYLGEAFHQLGRFADAARAYGQALGAAPEAQWAASAQLGLGWALFRDGRCAEALPALAAYAQRGDAEPRPDALFAEASCLLSLGRQDEALTRLEQILSRAPLHPVALESALLLSEAYQRQGRLVLAKEVLHARLRRPLGDAEKARVQLRLASIALDQGNAAQARTLYTLAAEQADSAVRQAALSGLGDTLLYLGELSAARDRYAQAAAAATAGPLAGYAAYQLARIQLQTGAFKPAVAALTRLAADPASGLADDARLALVIAHLNQGEQEQARALVDELRGDEASTPLAARAAYYGALVALGEEDQASAERLCQQAIERAPGTDEAFEARLLLADLQARQASAGQAIDSLTAWFREALPRHQRGRLAKRLADLTRSDGRCAEAIRWYDATMTWAPAFAAEAVYWTASCYEAGGDMALAIQWYQRSGQPPWEVRGQLAAAKLYERQEQVDAARAIYERLAQASIPEAPLIQERLAALNEAQEKASARRRQ